MDTNNLDYKTKEQIMKSSSENSDGAIKENNLEELTKGNQNDIPSYDLKSSDLLKGITEKLKRTFEQGNQIRIEINSPDNKIESTEIIKLTKDIESISKELNEVKSSLKEVIRNQAEEKAERISVIKWLEQINKWLFGLPKRKK